MSEEEDFKPKLNLNVNHDGSQITVKVKANTKFAKIFEVAEKRFSKEPGTLKFNYNGRRLSRDDTPADIEIEDGDQIDALLEQVGS